MSVSTIPFAARHGFKFFWRIEDFTRCRSSEGLLLRSPTFKVYMLCQSEWFAKIRISDERFRVFLCKSIGVFEECVNYSIHLLTTNGWDKKSEGFSRFLEDDEGYGCFNLKYNILINETLTVCLHLWSGDTRGRNARCLMNSEMQDETVILHSPFQKISRSTPDDHVFPFFCNSEQVPEVTEPENFKTLAENISDITNVLKEFVSFFKSTKITNSDKCIQTEATDNSNVFNDFKDLPCLFKEMKFNYVFLRTKTKEFAAHKALLCAQSTVFHAMFDKVKNGSSVVDVKDIDNDTLSLLVQFLHLEPLPALQWHSAAKMFRAADKYQIEQLKSKCISILKIELSEENVCDAYMFAYKHSDNELLQIISEYLSKNSKKVLSSSVWKSFILTETELASEIICQMNEKLVNCKS